MSKFEFDFDAIKGKTYEEGFKILFKQLEGHYNSNVNVRPSFVFGADPAMPSLAQVVELTRADPPPVTEKSLELIRVKADYEIKSGESLGLKSGYILTGVTDKDIEIFDYLKNYKEGDTVVEGDSGKYDLGATK